MFDLGNGTWIAPEFIVSISIRADREGDKTWEWAVGNGAPQMGLRSLGYASLQEFCDKLLSAIKTSKGA